MSIDRWMDKEDVVSIHNGILLSHEKEWNWVICSDVDGPRACHMEWSVRKRNKYCILNAYVWNLEKWYWWTYLQGRNRDINVEMWTKREKERVEWIGKIAPTYIHYPVWNRQLVGSCCRVQGAQLGVLWWPRGVGCGWWEEGWREGGSRGRGYVYTYSLFSLLYSKN